MHRLVLLPALWCSGPTLARIPSRKPTDFGLPWRYVAVALTCVHQRLIRVRFRTGSRVFASVPGQGEVYAAHRLLGRDSGIAHEKGIFELESVFYDQVCTHTILTVLRFP